MNNVKLIDRELHETIKKFRALEKHFAAKEQQGILKEGGKVLVDAVRSKVPDADETVFRYSTPKVRKRKRAPKGQGNVIAVYRPGNARRSYRILPLRRTKDIIVGPKVAKKSAAGVFSGRRVDGYYFHMLEYGTRHFGPIAPIRRGLAESKGAINVSLRRGFQKHMKKFELKHAR